MPDVPQDPARLAALEYRLRTYIGVDDLEHCVLRTKPITQSLPPEIRCFLKEDYIEHLSGVFSQSSHDGPYDRALESGTTLLAMYLLIYPENYPQIGSFHHPAALPPADSPPRHARARVGEDSLERQHANERHSAATARHGTSAGVSVRQSQDPGPVWSRG